MDSRLTQLISIIRETGGISPNELAQRMGVSVRTVRTYVNRVNELLANAENAHSSDAADLGRIEMRSASVYRLSAEDASVLDTLLVPEGAHTGTVGASVPDTAEARVTYLMNDLLSRADWITIDDLAQILYVSRVTISEDLKEVERRLERFDLSLERRPRYGIRVAGPELKRRLCLAALAVDARADADGVLLDRTLITTIETCVNEGVAGANYQINSIAYQNLLVHIAVAIQRIQEDCYVPIEDEQLERIRATREFPIAREIARLVGERLGVELPEEEAAYIAIHLAGRQRLYFAEDEGENQLVISDEVWDVVSRMLDAVWESFRFDFRDDLELRMTLAQHVVPLSVRLRFHMRMDNPLLSDIKQRYPLAWAMAVESSSVLADAYEARLSDEEVGYIALAFALALERQKGAGDKKNILIVCASGAGSARLLEHRYRREFGSFLNRIETCDVSSIHSVDLSGIDYVFTTVPLNVTLPVPVREVGFFLNEGDISRVRHVLQADATQRGAARAFSRELFVPHLAARGKDAVLDALCEAARAHRNMPDNLRALVQEREDLAPTSFGNRVAMPHPAEPCAEETFVCVGLLDDPVTWAEGIEVEAVFLVCIAKQADRDIQAFYESTARLLTSADDVDKLISQRDFDTLLELINR